MQNLHISKICCIFAENLEKKGKRYESTMDGISR